MEQSQTGKWGSAYDGRDLYQQQNYGHDGASHAYPESGEKNF
jgi:hypothetical protein